MFRFNINLIELYEGGLVIKLLIIFLLPQMSMFAPSLSLSAMILPLVRINIRYKEAFVNYVIESVKCAVSETTEFYREKYPAAETGIIKIPERQHPLAKRSRQSLTFY